MKKERNTITSYAEGSKENVYYKELEREEHGYYTNSEKERITDTTKSKKERNMKKTVDEERNTTNYKE